MYYEEQSRRINLLSGLVAGTVLGVGLALLVQPDGPRVRRARGRSKRGGGAASALRSAAERGVELAAHAAASRAVKRFRL